MIQNDDNFKVVSWGNGRDVLTIESDRLDACFRYFTSNKTITGVRIDPYLGFKLSNISFLKEFENLKGIILDGPKIDISSIQGLKELTYISISNNNQAIDYSGFPELTEIRSDWHSNMVITEKCNRLRHLCLWKYKPKSKDLAELPFLENLVFLGIMQSPIMTTNGIGRYTKLKQVEFAYCSKLTTLCDMKHIAIEDMNIEVCRKLKNHEYVENLQFIKKLKLNGCGTMKSIRFINNMKNLEDFRFVNTDVLDGDILPCLQLKGCGFTNKRHFSLTHEKVQQILREKQVSSAKTHLTTDSNDLAQ